jgi:hypothetical protein
MIHYYKHQGINYVWHQISHYQSPLSTQPRMVKNNQLTLQVRSLGLGQPSLGSRLACGVNLQCSGFSVTITLIPLYRNQFRYPRFQEFPFVCPRFMSNIPTWVTYHTGLSQSCSQTHDECVHVSTI